MHVRSIRFFRKDLLQIMILLDLQQRKYYRRIVTTKGLILNGVEQRECFYALTTGKPGKCSIGGKKWKCVMIKVNNYLNIDFNYMEVSKLSSGL